ncbi:MAG: HYR domain-containing protein [Bacteroidia bacterium]
MALTIAPARSPRRPRASPAARPSPSAATTNTFRVTGGQYRHMLLHRQHQRQPIADDHLPSSITGNNDPGQCSKVLTYTAPVGSDNCPGPVTVRTTGLASGAAFPVGTTTNTFRVTDAAGNTATCSFTVTISDTQVPTITCPANINLNNVTNTCGAVANFTAPVGADNCPGATTALTAGLASGATFPIGTTTNVFRVTDASGNTATCSFTVTVVDNQLPIITCPANISANVATGTCAVTVTYSAPIGTDNCPSATTTQTAGLASGASFSVGVTTNTFRVTDASGNTATCSFTVTVLDNELPMITCPANQSLNAGTGTCTATATYTAPVGADNCSGAATVQTTGLASGAAFPVGITTNTFRVTDASGNTATCSFTVTVTDNEAPALTCPTNISTTTQTGVCGAAVTYTSPVGTDNCSGVGTVMTSGLPSGATFPVGTTTIAFLSTDASGNTATCSFNVTVNDVTPPTAICQNVTIQLDSLGGASGTAALVNNGSNDACGVTSLVLSINAFSCSNVGSNAVVLTATDANGNTGTCSATVTVQDLIAPVATCTNATVDLNPSGTAVMGASVIGAGSFDNCSFTAALSQGSFNCSDIGVRSITLTLTDPSGNTASCAANVTVRDITPPSAVCSNATVTLNVNGQGVLGASVIGLGTSDACGAFTATISQDSFFCAHVGSNVVTLTATDLSGNSSSCTAVVMVVDNTAPQAICQSAVVFLDANGQGSITTNSVNNGSTDACGVLNATLDNAAFDCSDIGSNTVVLTIVDLSGNTASCSASVTVVDTIAPVAVCQNANVTLNSSGNGSLTVNQVDNGSTDVCGLGNATLDVIAFGCAQIGTQVVTLTVSDASGNAATCSANVLVEDITPPIALCHDATVQLDSIGTYSLTPAELNSNSNDACGIDTMTLSLSTINCSHVGNQSVTMTLTDGSGNSSSCTVVVTVEDLIAPVADCHAATIALDSLGSRTLTAADISNSTDNCGIVSNVLSATAFTCTDLGSHNVTLTMADASGNTSTCAVTVTVADSTAPVAHCQDVTLQLDSLGNATLLPAALDNGSTDACGIDTMSLSRSAFTCANLGVQSVTLIVSDASGNSSTCAATVTVNPSTMVASAQAIVQSCGYHVTCTGANDGSAFVTVTGGCSPYSYAWSNGATADSLSGLTAGVYTVTVSDASGQSSIQTLVLVQPDAVTVTFGGDSAVCLGSLAHLVAQPFGGNACQGFSYLWSNGATTDSISGLSAGFYTVTVTDAYGCSGIDSVNVNTSLVASLNLGADTLGCPGGDVQFTAPGGFSTYAWSNGAQTQTAALAAPGTYTCTVTDNEGCFASDTVQVGALTVDNDIITVNGHLPICIGDTVQLIGDAGLVGYQWSTGATSSSIFLTGQGGNIVLTAVEGQGCTIHDTVNVAFISVLGPEPVIVPGPAVTICQGSSVVLDAGGGYALWNWSSGDSTQTVSVSSAGTWSVTVENGFGCRGESDPVTVVVAPQPVVTLQDVSGTLVASSGFVNYDWLLNGQPILPNYHSSTLVPSQSGSYQVIGTDLNGCLDTSNAVVMTVVGTEAESSAILDIEIFPNPARDVLNLRALTSIQGPVTIEIWDMLGQRLEVRELSHLAGIETFDLSRYASASYMVRIQARKTGKEAAMKFIKN